MDFRSEIEIQERQNERKSAIITAIITAVLLLLSLVWRAHRITEPPIGDKDYEVVGAVDFGDYSQGSRSINNFQEAVPDPVDAPTPPQNQSQPQPTPQPTTPTAQQPTTTPTNTQSSNEITTPDLSPVSQPAPQETPRPDPVPQQTPTQPQPDPAPPTDNSNNSSSQNSQQQELDDDFTFNNSGGSNQGNADSGTGNSGAPGIKTLDPNGLYSFNEGSGPGGLKGRRALSLKDPQYTAQQEGQIVFEFTILPDGRVVNARPAGPVNQTALKNAGINAINQWRFSPIPPGQTRQNQTVRVTITFKLKG